MKYIFISVFLLLVVASVIILQSAPKAQSDIPILYWVTDPNPVRQQQIAMFPHWLEENYGDELETKYGFRRYELRIDAVNNDISKVVIQGVSGVGGDIIDIFGGGAEMRYLSSMGLLTDITEVAKKYNFTLARTYKSIESEITLNGRQYMFPCNVGCSMLWVNKATFEKYGLAVPPKRWDFATFEKLGRQFVSAANPVGTRNKVFFVDQLDPHVLRRSLGLSEFNETLTRCVLDDDRNICVLKLLYKWTYEDHILPSASDSGSFSSASGYGSSNLQLFNSGNYAMLYIGRNGLIQFRQFGSLGLSVSEIPYGEYPNSSVETRAAAIYAGSKYKDIAKYFMVYLTSNIYNMSIVEDADALPPNSIFVDSNEYKYPAKYPNEWGCHEVFSETVHNIAIPGDYSPFVLPQVAARIETENIKGFMANLYNAEKTVRLTSDQINKEIRQTLKDNPKLLNIYNQLVEDQKTIDNLRDKGQKIPLNLIRNPFYKRYYTDKGLVK